MTEIHGCDLNAREQKEHGFICFTASLILTLSRLFCTTDCTFATQLKRTFSLAHPLFIYQ